VDFDPNYDGQHFNAAARGPSMARTFVGPGVYTVAADVSYSADGVEEHATQGQLVTVTVSVVDAPAVVVLPPADVAGQEGQAVTFAAPQVLDLAG
jgi:hypothetical protein